MLLFLVVERQNFPCNTLTKLSNILDIRFLHQFIYCFLAFLLFENMAFSEDKRVRLEDALAFFIADADSDFSFHFIEEEEESSEKEIEVDNEEHSTNPERRRARGGLHKRKRTRGSLNRVNNFLRDKFENR